MTRTPRLHQLARLACLRIDAGRDRMETILAVLVEATAPSAALPDSYDRLNPIQREIVLALWGAGKVHVNALAKALGLSNQTTQRRTQRLESIGVLRRVERGTYEILPEGASPKLRLSAGSHALTTRIVDWLRATGGATVSEAARYFDVHPGTMSSRLRKLSTHGMLRNPRWSWYEAAEASSQRSAVTA